MTMEYGPMDDVRSRSRLYNASTMPFTSPMSRVCHEKWRDAPVTSAMAKVITVTDSP